MQPLGERASGEAAVGLGALLGLFTRLAALGGFLLELSLFLTVTWTTRPYYYGSDIGFAFAWTPLLIAGDGGVLGDSAPALGRSSQAGPADPQATLQARPSSPTKS